MKLSIRNISVAAVVAALLAGCAGSPKWTVNGTVADADGSTLILEAPGRAGWYVMDSVHLDNGEFSISEPALEHPEVFRLSMGGRQIYFPIDSTETVTLTTTAAGFGSDYTLTGSAAAEMLAHVDQRVRQAGVAGVDSLTKRELSGMLIGDPAGIVAYYIVRKQINGKPIFDPSNPTDLRVIGAVANAYDQYRPNDPRTIQLRNLFLAYKSKSRTNTMPSDTIYADEVRLFDIKLYDNKGVEQSLVDVAAKHKAVLLNYTLYTAEGSPALNVQLAKAYDRFHNAGLEIYQVAADADEYAWRQSAANLPWITVYQTPVSPAANLLNYNVTQLPATFLIVNGEIRERISDPTKIADAVSRAM